MQEAELAKASVSINLEQSFQVQSPSLQATIENSYEETWFLGWDKIVYIGTSRLWGKILSFSL